jgi:hypothetical protein
MVSRPSRAGLPSSRVSTPPISSYKIRPGCTTDPNARRPPEGAAGVAEEVVAAVAAVGDDSNERINEPSSSLLLNGSNNL